MKRLRHPGSFTLASYRNQRYPNLKQSRRTTNPSTGRTLPRITIYLAFFHTNHHFTMSSPDDFAADTTAPSPSPDTSSTTHNSPSPSPPSSSSSPLILYSPPTIWGLIRGAAINLFLPFLNGLMLGFGELLAHETAFRLGWSQTRVSVEVVKREMILLVVGKRNLIADDDCSYRYSRVIGQLAEVRTRWGQE